MAKTWQQPRWRNYAMQAAMWIIFAATLGAAALVGHHKRIVNAIRLGPTHDLGPVSISMPAGWDTIPNANGLAIGATEPSAAEPGEEPLPTRTITVYFTSPAWEGLRHAMGTEADGVTIPQSIEVGPLKGDLTVQRTLRPDMMEPGALITVRVRASLPDQTVLTIDLLDPSGGDPDEDVRLISAVAASVQLEKEATGKHSA
jgi:hypothetical protein